MSSSLNASRRVELDLFDIDSCFENVVSLGFDGFNIDIDYTFEIRNLQNEVIEVGHTVTVRDDGILINIPDGLVKGVGYTYTIKSQSKQYDTKYFQFGKIRVV